MCLELDELYETRRDLEDQIDDFFGDDHDPHYDDRGYQSLLERLDDINEQITEIDEKV